MDNLWTKCCSTCAPPFEFSHPLPPFFSFCPLSLSWLEQGLKDTPSFPVRFKLLPSRQVGVHTAEEWRKKVLTTINELDLNHVCPSKEDARSMMYSFLHKTTFYGSHKYEAQVRPASPTFYFVSFGLFTLTSENSCSLLQFIFLFDPNFFFLCSVSRAS